MSSINTNIGALVALRNLNTTNSALDRTQDRVSTGLRVTSPKEDGSTFSIAQGLRGDLKAFDAVQQSLSSGRGVVAAAIAGATAVSDLLADIKKKVIEASNPANTSTQQSILAADFTSMISQLNTFVSNAVYNGRNLISDSSPSVSITSTITGGQLTITSASALGGVSTAMTGGVATTTAALALLTTITAQELVIGNALGTLGSASKSIDFLTSFTKTLSDAVTEGLGALVDSDLAKESAQLQALQVKQQLGISALSIANQRPQSILALFQ